MCGIFGFVSKEPENATTVLKGLQYLEYRGYDSWGIAVAAEQSVLLAKAVGKIADASTSLPPATLALGHTRWATHGGVTYANAHPHVDCSARLALIHNGIVENYNELRGLLRREHTFLSQTDTEVLVHLLEETLQHQPDLVEALLTVFRQVEGLSAVAVLDSVSGQIAVAKNGSPLVLGWSDAAFYLSSDAMALVEHTRTISFLEDGQAAGLSADGIRVFDVETGAPVSLERHRLTGDSERAGLGNFAHFMDKEIHEQPAVLRHLASHAGEDARALAELIRSARDIYLVGCGTAHHAAMTGRYLLAEIAGTAAYTAAASEMSLVEPLLGPGSLVIALSQSGETIDVLEAVRSARQRGATIAALVNSEGSSLDRFADFSIRLHCGPERCVLATKSYTAKLAILHMAARAVCGELERGIQEVAEAADRVESLLDEERLDRRIAETARHIGDEAHLFILGKGSDYPLALEAALKIKEVTYMHAEGFASGELKHGVIALVTYGTPCIVLSSSHHFRRESLAAAAEVRARGAFTIGVSVCPEAEFDVTLPISGGASGPYEVAAVSQMLAYQLALLRGCDPDKPRNLAKSVTVK